ncbi:MAG: hypothetical protein ACE5FW_02060, partial [Candidatus Aenigmatarchaeota archaeon]
LELKAQESSQEACTELSEPVVFNLDLTNKGKESEDIELSIQGEPEWASLSETEVSVGPSQTKTLELSVNPEGLAGTQTITVNARSKESYARASGTVQLTVSDCFEFNAYLTPSEAGTCLKSTAEYGLVVENNGDTDTYRIVTPDWVKADADYLSLPGGQSREVGITATPRETGDLEFELEVSSERAPDMARKVTGSIKVEECRDVAVILAPSEREVCQGRSTDFKVTVKNLGSVEDVFTLVTNFGSLDVTKVILEPGESKDLKLTLDTSELVGDRLIEVMASSNGIFDKANAVVNSKYCHGVSVAIEPDEVETCPCSRVNYKVTVENTGEFQESYILTFSNASKNVTLGPGGKKSFNYAFTLPCDAEGVYNISASAVSEKAEGTGTSRLAVKKSEDCWSVQMAKGGQATVQISKSAVVPVVVKNIGEQPATYTLSIEGPEWVYLEPDELDLDQGEERTAYLYISPPYGIEEGSYSAGISADSEHASTSFDLTIEVVTNATGVTNKTVIINDTGTGMDVSITGQVTGVIPAWKTIVVGVITIIIIVILVVRFAFLVKT